ncbi:hypothetical protein G7085_06960 [Tessaracoccus sp. HDW20]|uniref:hypothetical protein n=1 Tax=Tessaracoccus coleopterorum TaxID=2714950 RepID=UPI0018D3440C|nr:hypothetical protein [Tessaracoccus coleopterorum]NHB84433.1 hypothetical protein [Tessaracoccus coleopterorum]
MTGRGAELRRAFVERARELGATLEPSDLALAFAPVPGSPGDRIVVAAWARLARRTRHRACSGRGRPRCSTRPARSRCWPGSGAVAARPPT